MHGLVDGTPSNTFSEEIRRPVRCGEQILFESTRRYCLLPRSTPMHNHFCKIDSKDRFTMKVSNDPMAHPPLHSGVDLAAILTS